MTMEEQVFENKINRWKEDWRQELKMELAEGLVKNLILNSNFSNRDIAKLVNMSVKFVKSMRTQTGLIAP